MPREGLTGSRIRERRTIAGIKQADLAKQSGISASYLNLIEHNRRRIGGKLLLDIAAALAVEPSVLTVGAEAALVATLREAGQGDDLPQAEAERVEEFAGRFPGWAKVLAGAHRRNGILERTVEVLTDRLAHDPQLAASLHEVLSTAAAIRSTASILAHEKDLSGEWRNRFHVNLNEDSRRLADSARALVGYLDSDAGGTGTIGAPQDEVEAFLDAHDNVFSALEDMPGKGARSSGAPGENGPGENGPGENGHGDGYAATNPPGRESVGDAAQVIDALIDGADSLKTDAARQIARGLLEQIAKDAAQVPLAGFRAAVADSGALDPVALARRFGAPVSLILRRLASLPDLGAGLVVCDRSGSLLVRKATQGFAIPRYGACCPLWPLFAVLGQPGRVHQGRVTQLGRSPVEFDCIAVAEIVGSPVYNAAPLVQATMLIMPRNGPSDPVVAAPTPVGSTCRVCPRAGCPARREPSILSDGF